MVTLRNLVLGGEHMKKKKVNNVVAREILMSIYSTLNIVDKNPIHWITMEALQAAMVYLLEINAEFKEDDFIYFKENCRLNEWFYMTNPHSKYFMNEEKFYALATKKRNESACRAFEFWRKRPRIMVGYVRVHVGLEFNWNGKMFRCSSFNEQRGFITVIPIKIEYSNHTRYAEKIGPHRRINFKDLIIKSEQSEIKLYPW